MATRTDQWGTWDDETFLAWHRKRDAMAEAFKCDPSDVPAEAVWYVQWPPGHLTDAERAYARTLADFLTENGVSLPE